MSLTNQKLTIMFRVTRDTKGNLGYLGILSGKLDAIKQTRDNKEAEIERLNLQ